MVFEMLWSGLCPFVCFVWLPGTGFALLPFSALKYGLRVRTKVRAPVVGFHLFSSNA